MKVKKSARGRGTGPSTTWLTPPAYVKKNGGNLAKLPDGIFVTASVVNPAPHPRQPVEERDPVTFGTRRTLEP